MKTPCPCGRIHASDAVRAVNRFNPDRPTGWRAGDGQVRATRAEAMADVCEMWREE